MSFLVIRVVVEGGIGYVGRVSEGSVTVNGH